MSSPDSYDVLIIGSGAAGLSAALKLDSSLRVAVLSKGEISSGSTPWAQGGIAAVLDQQDNEQSHIQDTLIAGAGLCHQDAVEQTVNGGKVSIKWLKDQGVDFTRDSDAENPKHYHLTKEGGHSHRRVVHADDATGHAISSALCQQTLAAEHIDVFTNRVAIDLITHKKLFLPGNRCVGAYVLNRENGEVELFRARFVIIATGGASKAYLYTSNPDGASGDGIAMAWRSGCRVANMEFNQFHPTCLYHPQAKTFLITEAVRGEGGHLLLPNGERFMHRFDERLELAPRDIVARAIDHEMKRLGADCLYLDISHKDADFIKAHFPTIYDTCLGFGIDITKEPIPIVPAAHYTCGGVMVDHRGRSDVNQLYVLGEASFTGLHGANRMASNSLLECIVYGHAAAEDINKKAKSIPEPPEAPAWDESRVIDSDEDVVISHNWDELRRFMWDYVGIVRTDKRLQRAKHRVDLLHQEILDYYSNFSVNNDLLELRNLVTVADLIICSAIQRKESRGLHYTLDYPSLQSEANDTVLTPTNFSTRDW
ncbi:MULTISPECIES: L-aspartate oxidase [unclassified Oleiphilus]|uniref:L-aspartate oxidase n=4 Tax=Oleiphilus TaxID=141450 RepID=UPI0007C3CF9C|nr:MULTISPECIES: L-aspartate oxidase [unclassified Oleiphilus]KZY63855.1 L-aspartate oxidase [Oleiphilus sp. HI0066]KZY67504.1 L-aspartate oxidase [Oleiphilus sp. HI0067]KZZ59998.1 L-aspartate oxidase [Oleiphilus sp. HI0125]